MIPQIKEIYDNSSRKELEVLAVSLDTHKEEWLNFIKENNVSWLNASDSKAGIAKLQNHTTFMLHQQYFL